MIFEMLRINNQPNYISSNSSRNISINYGGLYLRASLAVAIEFTIWLATNTDPTHLKTFTAKTKYDRMTKMNTENLSSCDASIVRSVLLTNINYLRHAIHFINYKCHHGVTSRFDVPMCLIRKENHFCHLCPSRATFNVRSPIIIIMCNIFCKEVLCLRSRSQ